MLGWVPDLGGRVGGGLMDDHRGMHGSDGDNDVAKNKKDHNKKHSNGKNRHSRKTINILYNIAEQLTLL